MAPSTTLGNADTAAPPAAPMELRVLSVTHDPLVDSRSGRRLSEVMGWHNARELEAQYARDVEAASHGLLRYRVVERREIDGFPAKVDGFQYAAAAYLRCWRAGGGFREPDSVDYHALLSQVKAAERVDAGEVDEVWLFGFPYCGYYESMMVGPGAFWCNAPPLPPQGRTITLPRCGRRFVVMGFNFERDVGCMLENLGHRAESIMAEVYAGRHGEHNLWHRFTRYEQTAPGQASAGNVHFAPNSRHDYDWGNSQAVWSDCDDWLRFPHLTGERKRVTCRDWGDGDMRQHHMWWFNRLPHVAGQTDGVLNNWWTYIGDPNNV
ncbi:MAG TPA: hypothetical protein VNM48_22520 [Chloroflexota bacterium]|nr:hypothetical protein [Chloroflexota bacterium]